MSDKGRCYIYKTYPVDITDNHKYFKDSFFGFHCLIFDLTVLNELFFLISSGIAVEVTCVGQK